MHRCKLELTGREEVEENKIGSDRVDTDAGWRSEAAQKGTKPCSNSVKSMFFVSCCSSVFALGGDPLYQVFRCVHERRTSRLLQLEAVPRVGR